MSRLTKLAFAALALASGLATAQSYPQIGRPATAKEVAAWDIDVRPDFKGLPKGAGSVQKGQQVWEGRCASCHGTFGESNEVFTPLIGGTTPDDIKTGRVAALSNGRQPQRTTIMKVATVSTLWDYIHRAMPWNAPKSLSTDEVYAVVAYLLNLAEIVPDDFTLSDQNIGEVQKRMPNRNGMVQYTAMWDVKGKPDVKSVACMKDCPVSGDIRSTLPEAARNVHGNLAEQNRPFGPVRGTDTTKPPAAGPIAPRPALQQLAAAAPAPKAPAGGLDLAKANGCVACHGVNNRIVGPAFSDVAAKYKGDAGAAAKLAAKVRGGTSGTWGAIPMPPQAQVKEEDVKSIIGWILKGAN